MCILFPEASHEEGSFYFYAMVHLILSICFTFLDASVAMGGNELGSSFPGKAVFQPDLHVIMFSVSVLFQLQIKLHIYEIKSRKKLF